MDNQLSATLVNDDTFMSGLEFTVKGNTRVDFGKVLRFFRLMETLCLYDTVYVEFPEDADPNVVKDALKVKKGISISADSQKRVDEFISKEGRGWVSSGAMAISLLISPVLREAHSEGILKHIVRRKIQETSSKLIVDSKKEKRDGLITLLQNVVTANSEQESLIVWRLFVSQLMEFSYIPDFLELNVLASTEIMKTSRRIESLLHSSYQQLSNTLMEDLNNLQQSGRSVDVFIPPIPAVILNKASTPEDVGDVLLEVRRGFEPVRKAFREYELALRDDKVPLAESMGALKRLSEISESLSKKFADRDQMSITEWRDVFDIIPKDLEFSHLSEGNLLKFILGKPIERLRYFLRNRRILYLYRLRDKFLKIKNYATLLNKVYGIELNADNIQRYRQYQVIEDEHIRKYATHI